MSELAVSDRQSFCAEPGIATLLSFETDEVPEPTGAVVGGRHLTTRAARAALVALVGAGCTGKTTAFNAARRALPPSRTYGYLEERAREFFERNPTPWQNRTSWPVQRVIQSMIMSAETKAMTRHRVILADRCAWCAAVYVHLHGDYERARRLAVRAKRQRYDAIMLFSPEGVSFDDDGLRTETDDDRWKTHAAYLRTLDSDGVPYELVTGDPDERADRVIETMRGLSLR